MRFFFKAGLLIQLIQYLQIPDTIKCKNMGIIIHWTEQVVRRKRIVAKVMKISNFSQKIKKSWNFEAYVITIAISFLRVELLPILIL